MHICLSVSPCTCVCVCVLLYFLVLRMQLSANHVFVELLCRSCIGPGREAHSKHDSQRECQLGCCSLRPDYGLGLHVLTLLSTSLYGGVALKTWNEKTVLVCTQIQDHKPFVIHCRLCQCTLVFSGPTLVPPP